MARLEFSRKTKNAIIKRADGKCEACKANLKPGEGEVDHILPCELGGEPTIANGRLICRPCHKEKTANDIRAIRKSDRQRDKATGAIKPAGKIPTNNSLRTREPRADKLPIPDRRPIYGRTVM
jgi:5-methylcytosine-specific restriction endonuclease McrA